MDSHSGCKFVQTIQAAKCSRGSAPLHALWRQATSVAILVHPNSCFLGLNKAKKKKERKEKSLSSDGISLFNRKEASSQQNSCIPLPQMGQVFTPGLILSSRDCYTNLVPKALRRTPSQWSDSSAHSTVRTLEQQILYEMQKYFRGDRKCIVRIKAFSPLRTD